MNAKPNPYAPPRDLTAISAIKWASKAIQTYPGRSLVAILLAMLIAGTAILLGWLWSIGALDLGAFGYVFLVALVLATLVLLTAARFYMKGARKYAVGLVVLVPLLIVSAMLLSMHEAGVFTLL